MIQDNQLLELPTIKSALESNDLPDDLKEKLLLQLDRIEKASVRDGYRIEYDKDLDYIKFVAGLPFNKSSADNLDLNHAKQTLEKNHYGIQSVKDRILEYLSVLILNQQKQAVVHGQTIMFLGLVGSGKTSLAYSVAESLNRQLIRIPFGGLGSANLLRGQSRVFKDSEPGILMKMIEKIGVNNPIILLDEIDRVAIEARNDIMGVLVELLDPEQNNAFIDRYIDYPFDLSKALFIATANNTANLATAVLDRMEVIEMPSYSDEEKEVIAKNYLLPKSLKESGLAPDTIIIDDSLWPQIVRPLGFDAGIRSLQRNVMTLTRKIARQVVEGNPGPYKIDSSNLKEYLG